MQQWRSVHISQNSRHLGNIAYRTGKKLVWDGIKFTNDEDANKYLIPDYRAPWKLPKIYSSAFPSSL